MILALIAMIGLTWWSVRLRTVKKPRALDVCLEGKKVSQAYPAAFERFGSGGWVEPSRTDDTSTTSFLPKRLMDIRSKRDDIIGSASVVFYPGGLSLQEMLEIAENKENYEECARLRDLIKAENETKSSSSKK